MKPILSLLLISAVMTLNSIAEPKESSMSTNPNNLDTATFAAGCFWCVEAIFEELNGVESVVSGYSGGIVENPSYKDVTSGTSGHAEACQISFDPAIISFDELVMVFWQTHNPTTMNRQGNDFGSQYRSAIFYHTEEQKAIAEQYKNQLDMTGAWEKPIVTEIKPLTKFYKAESDHQDYFQSNTNVPYCTYVIQPKLDSFREVFKDKLKK